ncbi:MAG: indolepyruvate oxidoreductase subunit beta [Hyphomicrobiales bacterium]
MTYDILLAGVGGQGVLSMAAVIGRAALAEGLHVKQSEVHGMAQRGGAVLAHLRLSDAPIESDLIARGTADLILSLEPVESLRYLAFLAPKGALVTTSNPFVNIPDYPPIEDLLATIRTLPRTTIVDAEWIATEAGDVQALNAVMVGAAMPLLPLRPESVEAAVREQFGRKGDDVLRCNLAALRAGRTAAGGVAASALAKGHAVAAPPPAAEATP